ncbi:MAG: hypothetical protein Q9201_003527 [Fulgogasparrea decipioides]
MSATYQHAFISIVLSGLISLPSFFQTIHGHEHPVETAPESSSVINRRAGYIKWSETNYVCAYLRTPLVLSSPVTPALASDLNLPPNITSLALAVPSHSEEKTSEYNFLLTVITTLQAIYDENPNRSELVTRYIWPPPSPPSSNAIAINISAVGRGREEGSPITFNYGALALCLRMIGECSSLSAAYRWLEFEFQIGWSQREGEATTAYAVARGNFTAIEPPPLLPDSRQGRADRDRMVATARS